MKVYSYGWRPDSGVPQWALQRGHLILVRKQLSLLRPTAGAFFFLLCSAAGTGEVRFS